jgi:RNA polymerase Rpb5, N-terminal domain
MAVQHSTLARCFVAQDELNMTKEQFKERYSDEPRKDDLTVLAPKQDDPTEQVELPTGWADASAGSWRVDHALALESLCGVCPSANSGLYLC